MRPDGRPRPWVQGIALALVVAIVLGVLFCIIPRLNP